MVLEDGFATFVGLLAAGFAFLFGILMSIVRERLVELRKLTRNREYLMYDWERRRKAWKKYRGEEGFLRYKLDWQKIISKFYIFPAVPLMLYFESLGILVGGFWWGDASLFIVGVLFLMIAVFMSGVVSCWLLVSSWSYIKNETEYMWEKRKNLLF